MLNRKSLTFFYIRGSKRLCAASLIAGFGLINVGSPRTIPQHNFPVFIDWLFQVLNSLFFTIFIRICRIKIPYPLQWGVPIFDAGHAFGMMAAVMVSLVEVFLLPKKQIHILSCKEIIWLAYVDFDCLRAVHWSLSSCSSASKCHSSSCSRSESWYRLAGYWDHAEWTLWNIKWLFSIRVSITFASIISYCFFCMYFAGTL